MATIKEMAHNHVVTYMHNDEYEEMQDTYIAGANDVIKELESLVTTLRTGARKLFEDKIKELKGE